MNKPYRSISTRLLTWYRKNARDLPWRRTRDPYKIWVSEIMLQQTTVNTVIPYYERWIRLFPTIRDLAKANLQQVLRAWQGMGYYQRARNLHQSARLICRNYHARLPEQAEILRQLPGFGDYTTAAVLSIAFDQRLPLIDTNVRRVALRLNNILSNNHHRHDHRLRDFLSNNLPRRNIHLFNQALMELGALICRPNDPDCPVCPLRLSCQAFQHGDPILIGDKTKKKYEHIQVVAALIQRNDRCFIQRRPPGGLLGDMWEFPGGKVRPQESLRAALKREVKEELGIGLVIARPWIRIRHSYTRFKVDLNVWHCKTRPWPRTDRTHKWVAINDLSRYPMPSANVKILNQLRNDRKDSSHAHTSD